MSEGLTKGQVKNYLEGPGNCPRCGSDRTAALSDDSRDEFTDNGGEIQRELVCAECKKMWREYFKLHDLEALDEDGCAIPNEEDKTHTQEAFDMGRVAFQRGVPCVPALDGDYLKHLFPTLGENVEATKAWIMGWTTEKLKEPTT